MLPPFVAAINNVLSLVIFFCMLLLSPLLPVDYCFLLFAFAITVNTCFFANTTAYHWLIDCLSHLCVSSCHCHCCLASWLLPMLAALFLMLLSLPTDWLLHLRSLIFLSYCFCILDCCFGHHHLLCCLWCCCSCSCSAIAASFYLSAATAAATASWHCCCSCVMLLAFNYPCFLDCTPLLHCNWCQWSVACCFSYSNGWTCHPWVSTAASRWKWGLWKSVVFMLFLLLLVGKGVYVVSTKFLHAS